MEFWGVEVPAGKPTSCSPGDGMYLHVSQAALGESAKSGKGNERVVVKVQVDDNEVVLGTLTEGKCDQMPLDLVFDREFQITHNSNSSSVYICGYRTEGPDDYDDESEDEDEEEDGEEDNELVPAALPIKANGDTSGKHSKAGKSENPVKSIELATEKATNELTKAIMKGIGKKAVAQPESDDDDESDDEEFGSDDSDEEMDEDDDDEDDEDDEDESDESDEEELKIEETPKSGKKRTAGNTSKSSSAEKKTKVEGTPQQGKEAAAEYWQSLIDAGSKGQALTPAKKGAKSGPVTPVAKAPAAKEVKTPTDKGQKPAKTPKGTPSAPPNTPLSDKKIGQIKCSGCDRTFTTESAMTQHAAAKHK